MSLELVSVSLELVSLELGVPGIGALELEQIRCLALPSMWEPTRFYIRLK